MGLDDLAADQSEGVTILCEDHQDEIEIDTQRWATLARNALVHEGVTAPTEMGLLFVAAPEIAALNEEHLGGTGPTDVLAFPIDDVDPIEDRSAAGQGDPSLISLDAHPPRLLGDVVVCPTVAAQAVNTGGDLVDELALLVVHGVLHLLGHDHAEVEEKAVMQAREHALLSAYASPGAQ